MTICKFWQQGTCRYGSNCRFEHPQSSGSRQQQSQGANRFGVLANQNQNQGNRGSDPDTAFLVDSIERDLTAELPQWILSSYGPGRGDPPRQLMGGPQREQSFEEMKLLWMEHVLMGKEQEGLNLIGAEYQAAQEQIKRILSNVHGAVKYMNDGAKEHPNRADICQQAGSGTGEFLRGVNRNVPVNNVFAAAQPQSAGAFGQPSGLGQTPNPFGTPAFSQPTQPAAANPFGQPAAPAATPSAFATPATSAFGQTSALGAKPNPFGAPGFGQPAQPANTPAFGQPTQPSGGPAFGQPTQPGTAPAFGQPTQPASAFGQASALGAKPNPFGTQAGPSPFGTAGVAGAQSTTSVFGKPTQAPSPFGQPAPPSGPAAQTNNPFGKPVTPPSTNPFGQPATQQQQQQQPAANPFGQSAAAPSSNPFGQPASQQTPASNPNPFGQPPSQASTTNANPFGQPATNLPPAQPQIQGAGPYAPGATRQHPPLSSYVVKTPDNRLQTFKGQPVVFVPVKGKQAPMIPGFDGSKTRVWFPDGPPAYTSQTEAEDPKVYEDPGVREQWEGFVNSGEERFKGGLMPEVPPKREYCSWVF